jgi:hypothetical protein
MSVSAMGALVKGGSETPVTRGPDAHYALPVPVADERRALAVAWLVLGLAALVASGIYSIALVAARTPFLAPLFPVADFFRVALVVHVDLSVLVWFVAFAGLAWTINGAPRLQALAWGAFACAAVGTALMSLAPFAGRGEPIMANYVPVLDGPLFLAGLLVFALGGALLALRALAVPARVGFALDGVDALRFGLNAAAVSAALAKAARPRRGEGGRRSSGRGSRCRRGSRAPATTSSSSGAADTSCSSPGRSSCSSRGSGSRRSSGRARR